MSWWRQIVVLIGGMNLYAKLGRGTHNNQKEARACSDTHVENKLTKEKKEGRNITVTVMVLKWPFMKNFGDMTL